MPHLRSPLAQLTAFVLDYVVLGLPLPFLYQFFEGSALLAPEVYRPLTFGLHLLLILVYYLLADPKTTLSLGQRMAGWRPEAEEQVYYPYRFNVGVLVIFTAFTALAVSEVEELIFSLEQFPAWGLAPAFLELQLLILGLYFFHLGYPLWALVVSAMLVSNAGLLYRLAPPTEYVTFWLGCLLAAAFGWLLLSTLTPPRRTTGGRRWRFNLQPDMQWRHSQ